jgi:spermidine synthase
MRYDFRPMIRTAAARHAGPKAVGHVLPAIVLLFAGSGCAALIYQIVWLQLLQLVIGSSAVSMAVLLAAFMGGMCIGSALAPSLIDARRHPLRVYAVLELAIGVCGLALLFSVPVVHALYAKTGGGITVRAIVAMACLLPPTIMMGATLPALARWVESSRTGISWLGFFYGGNLAGAVVGTLLAGFYLLRVFDMAIATYSAVAINTAVAGASLFLASRVPRVLGERDESRDAVGGAAPKAALRLTSCVAAASGFTALAAEVIWTRLLSLAVGATV